MNFEAGTWGRYERDGNVSSYAVISNCTESEISSSCVCSECNDNGCLLHCPKNVCYVYSCWNKDWGLITATQVSVFILFVLGIVSLIVVYFRVCNRAIERDYTDCPAPQTIQNDECIPNVTQISIIENRGRPPSYSEACSAPPLYSSPYNRVSMLEPPPVYPETPKLSERDLQPNHPAVVHHI